jgi:hypothetical protein
VNENKSNRQYISFKPNEGWPAANDLFYECLECNTILSSVIDGDCQCHNLYIEAYSGRMGANKLENIRLFRVLK